MPSALNSRHRVSLGTLSPGATSRTSESICFLTSCCKQPPNTLVPKTRGQASLMRVPQEALPQRGWEVGISRTRDCIFPQAAPCLNLRGRGTGPGRTVGKSTVAPGLPAAYLQAAGVTASGTAHGRTWASCWGKRLEGITEVSHNKVGVQRDPSASHSHTLGQPSSKHKHQGLKKLCDIRNRSETPGFPVICEAIIAFL